MYSRALSRNVQRLEYVALQSHEYNKTFTSVHSLVPSLISTLNPEIHPDEFPEIKFKSSNRTDSEDILDYGASVITRLRTDLDHERKAHCKAVGEANFRISELEAQVATREAMLEASIPHHPKREKSPLDCSRQPRNSDSEIPPPKPMTDDECLRVLADNSARNKSLEIEIQSLTRKVRVSFCWSFIVLLKNVDLLQLDRARGTAGSPPFVPADVPSLGPSSSPRTPLGSSHQPVTLRQPPITHESPLRSPPNPLSTVPADVATQTPSQDRATVFSTYGSQRSIAQLDDQISTCTTQLETFKAERKTLTEVAVRDRRVRDMYHPHDVELNHLYRC